MRFSLIAVTGLLCLLTAINSVTAVGQENLRPQLFGETDKILQAAKEKNAHLYSPRIFEQGMEAYQDAEDAFKRGRDLQDIRALLAEAGAQFQKAIDGVSLGELTFASVMNARNDAISADAPKFVPELWEKAEKEFRSAGYDLEDGDVNDAKAKAAEAEGIYRSAELEAIKGNYLGPARDLLQKAEDLDVEGDAPRTLENAAKLTAQVEDLLKSNRYDTDEARQLAQEAKIEAQHAINLHERIAAFSASGGSLEELLLQYESYLATIAKALDMVPRFDNGAGAMAEAMAAEIETREATAVKSDQTIKQHEQEIANLKQQVASMESRVGNLTQAERELKRRIDIQKRQEETFAEVSAMFTKQEGMVLRDGDKGIIRLYGLTFPVGKNTIEPKFFGLLTKVQDAVRKFGKCQISVEGHTDSRGGDTQNLRLSETRAQAVAEYLRANMGGGIPIVAQGFGESRPVASNDAESGRARNRRIDIIIVPEWAVK